MKGAKRGIENKNGEKRGKETRREQEDGGRGEDTRKNGLTKSKRRRFEH